MDEREELYNRLRSSPNYEKEADFNDPDIQKAIQYYIEDRNTPKEPHQKCKLCGQHTLKQCFKCLYYFCDKHVDTDRMGDHWCEACDERLKEMFPE